MDTVLCDIANLFIMQEILKFFVSDCVLIQNDQTGTEWFKDRE